MRDTMNRRDLFRFLPLAVIPGAAMTAEEPQKPAEPSPWVEMTCQREAVYDWVDVSKESPNRGFENVYERGKMLTPACGTRFKFIRGAHPICPKCGFTQLLSHENG